MSEEKSLQTTAEDTDLTTLGDLMPSVVRPEGFDPTVKTGAEEIRPDEVNVPRLAVAQGTSSQIASDSGDYIPGLAVGQMFNTLTREIYGPGPMFFVPARRHVSRIEKDPNDRNVIIDRDVPWNDDRMKWHGNEPPRAIEYVEFVSLLVRKGKAPEEVVLSIKTTNRFMKKAAREVNTNIARGGAIWDKMYSVSSKIERGKSKKTGEDTSFGVFVTQFVGFVPGGPVGDKLKEFAKRLYEMLEGKELAPVGGRDEDTAGDADESRAPQDADVNFEPHKM